MTTTVVQFLLAAGTLFAFYALLALGMGLIFGQLRVVNVAHGEMATLGAFIMYLASDIPFYPRLLIAVLAGIVLGYVAERFMLRSLYVRGVLAALLAMWGLSIVIREGLQVFLGATPRSVAAPIGSSVEVLGVGYPLYRLIGALIALTVVCAFLLVVFKTDLGLKLRASIQNREMASVMGISPSLMITGTFIVGTCFAVLAGALQAPTLGVTPTVGMDLLAPAFFSVLIMRPGSFTGPIFGAFIVAVLTTVLRSFFDGVLSDVILYSILILVMIFRPQGLNWTLSMPTGRKPKMQTAP